MSISIWLIVFALLNFLTYDPLSDLRNHINIVTVSDHSENIGIFWYIMIEVKIYS